MMRQIEFATILGSVRCVKSNTLFKTMIISEPQISYDFAVDQKLLGAQGISNNIVPVNLEY